MMRRTNVIALLVPVTVAGSTVMTDLCGVVVVIVPRHLS